VVVNSSNNPPRGQERYRQNCPIYRQCTGGSWGKISDVCAYFHVIPLCTYWS